MALPPTEASDLYKTAIQIEESASIRAIAFRPGYESSEIVTQTYLIRDSITLPIISLVTDPPNLWDSKTGIYANATSHGFAWERPVTMEYFDIDGQKKFDVNAGLRIHGGASRTRSEKKSFRVYFRSEYGPGRLDYPLIPSTGVESFDSFILRAGYNDSWIHWDDMERYVAVYISDQLGRDVHSDMGFVASHGIYAELFLNGEYWGLYNLCERIEGEFLTSYYGFDDWDIISDDELKEGDWTEWNRLHNFINHSDLSNPDNYQTFQEMVDLKQITSYYILNIWVQNHDWPHHNWYAARERHPQGRWKLIVWDIEDSFGSGASRGSYNMNTFANAQGSNSIGNLFRACSRIRSIKSTLRMNWNAI